MKTTLFEQAAIAAMQGLLSGVEPGSSWTDYNWLADHSCNAADALVKEIEKRNEPVTKPQLSMEEVADLMQPSTALFSGL